MSDPETPPPRQTSPWGRWLVAIVLVGSVVAFYLSGLHRTITWEFIRTNVDTWQRQVEANLLPAVLIYFALYVTVTALSLPVALFMSLLGGALFGLWLGVGVIGVAATLGATLAFLSSRYLLRDWVRRRLGARLEALDEGVRREGAYYLFALRLVPAVPFFLINLGMGLTAMRVGTFALVTWVGILPGTFVFVNVGTQLSQVESLTGLLSWQMLGAFALLGVMPLVLRKLVAWLRPRRAK
jgi:uncharacterized membrane protein YdjX (TVP38/TMEM64 family)